MVMTLRECPEVGTGACVTVGSSAPRHVLVHRFDGPEGSMLFLHNLGSRSATVRLYKLEGVAPDVHEVFADRAYPAPAPPLEGLRLGPYGYRWIRLSHSVGSVGRRGTPPAA